MKITASLSQVLPLAVFIAASHAFAHNPSAVWITPSGHTLTGTFAIIERNEAANRITVGEQNTAAPASDDAAPPPQAAAFRKFAPAVRTRWDDDFLYIESNGLPAHGMMTGITSWQQQVPLPQPYRGTNAWRLPRRPEPATNPISMQNVM